MLTRNRRLMAVVPIVLLAVAAAAVVVTSRGADRWRLSADFADTTGVYVGNEVQYLGVPVGTITSITPHGPVMRVHMVVDDDVKLPGDASAEILQSALLTDRFVALGPVYRGGVTLPPDSVIGVERTRSPISFDDLGTAIDDLVVALDRQGPDGRDIGDVIAVTADNLEGNGDRLRTLISSSRDALASINRKEPDLQAVVSNLDVLARTLGENDATVRRFTKNLRDTSETVAGQTESLDKTLRSLVDLTDEVSTFVERNRGALKTDLRDVAAITETIRQQQTELAHTFDYLPTGAENIARAHDPDSGSIRVVLALRDMAIFNGLVRQEFCALLAEPVCPYFANAEGTGLFDVILDGIESQLPGRFP